MIVENNQMRMPSY